MDWLHHLEGCKAAVDSLRAWVEQAKACRSQCWGIFEAALPIQIYFERIVRAGHLLDGQAFEGLPELFGAAISTVASARDFVKVESDRMHKMQTP